jgi:hypothetical protein
MDMKNNAEVPGYQGVFDRDFLSALSEWQRGWNEDQDRRREIADTLLVQCDRLPIKFKQVDTPCYRKRFIMAGEIVPIMLDDDMFEGIASWTTNLNSAKGFKEILRQDSKFACVFKHTAKKEEVIINISSLWQDSEFVSEVHNFQEIDSEKARVLLNFRDKQSEVVLRSTLRGSELEHIVGISKSFDEICDMANIPEGEREELGKEYYKNPNGIPIQMPTFASSEATRAAVQKTINTMIDTIKKAKEEGKSLDFGSYYRMENKNLKHK